MNIVYKVKSIFNKLKVIVFNINLLLKNKFIIIIKIILNFSYVLNILKFDRSFDFRS